MAAALCVFDAYGTLFDVAAAARRAAGEPGREAFAGRWAEIAETWRRKQLEYTWLRASAGIHADFWRVTEDGLDYALAAAGLAEPELRARLLALYRELDAYPEAAGVLDALRASGHATAILSNASPAMLSAAMESAGLGPRLDAALSAESAGVFKPDFRVYALVPETFGVARRAVLFVSSNGWDAWGAAAFGFRTVWVNRAGAPAERLPHAPEHEVADLSALPAIAAGI